MISIIINTIGFIQSLFLGSVLVIAGQRKSFINVLTGILLIIFSVLILNSLRILIYSSDYYISLELISNFLLVLVGPMFFLLAKYQINGEDKIKKDLIHLVPFFLLFGMAVIFKLTKTDRLFSIVESISGLFLIISMTLYLVFSLIIIFKNRTNFDPTFKMATIGFFIVWHLNLIFQFLEYFSDFVNEEAQIWATLILSFLVVLLTFRNWLDLMKKANPAKSKLIISPQRRKVILSKVEQELLTNKPYLDPKFSLSQLSQSIEEPSSYISKVINAEKQMTFPMYIAEWRVKEFIQLLSNKENLGLTLKGLSEKVGFKSSSTFNKAFKLHTGLLPSEYLKSIKEA